MMRRESWILVTSLWLALVPVARAAGEDDPSAVVTDYLAAVVEESWADARACWSSAYLAEAAALGITYTGVPCPWDLASPVIQDHLVDRVSRGRVVAVDRDAEPVTVTVASADGGDTDAWVYAVIREDGSWRLADRIWAAGRTWPVRNTRYCRLQGEGVDRLDPRACRELDLFVESCVLALGADDARLSDLAQTRIPYYVVDDATVAALTGHPTKGMANLAAGSVISSHFPHFHELVHLLVNLVLGEVPLRTHPLMQEGLACRMGGRWGRSGEVVLYTGWFHLDQGMVRLGDVLTFDGFHGTSSGPDGSYALAALVCDLVVERSGWRELMDLHLQLSGSLEDLRGMSAQEVAAAVGEACSLPGRDPVAELEDAVLVQAARWRRCGVYPGPGGMPTGRIRSAETPRGRLDWLEVDNRWTFRLLTRDDPCSVLLSAPSAGGFSSALYREQWPDRTWDGTRWGLVCRPGSVSLYDYVTNRLTGTWVGAFSGEVALGAGDPPLIVFTIDPPAELDEEPTDGSLPRLD